MAALGKIEDDISNSRTKRNQHILAHGADTEYGERKLIQKRVATMKSNLRQIIQAIEQSKETKGERWYTRWQHIETSNLQIIP